MSDQFTVKHFSRGVKLTIDHQFDPLLALQGATVTANVDRTAERLGCCQASWVIPWTGPGAVARDGIVAFLPFLLPPFQQLFDRNTLAPPKYVVTLADLSLSIDQRAEPLAVVGPHSTSAAGFLTAADMSRYDMTVRLLERQPSLVTGDTTSTREVLKLEIPGITTFGAGDAGVNVVRNNPLLIDDLSVQIKPFGVYVWQINCPGLMSALGGGIDWWTCTVGGGFVAGDIARLTVDVTNYDYVVAFGDTATVIATAIAALAVANFFYEVTSAGAVVTLRSRFASAGVAVASLFLAGAGTFVAVHTHIGGPGTVEQLALVSLNLTASFVSPLTVRDSTSDFGTGPGIQNIPNIHNGDRFGTTVPVTVPAPDDLITGADIQDANHGFDEVLRRKGKSGYGTDGGALGDTMQAADIAPHVILKNDAHYHVIVVPMWGGQFREALRAEDVPQAGLPYIAAPWTDPTMDRRVVPVPEGFVLHHAFAVWNGYSPISTAIYNRTIEGAWPTAPDYEQQVGIMLNSGMRSDDYQLLQLGLLAFTPAGGANPYTGDLVDEFFLPDGTVNPAPCYRVLQIPLAGDGGAWTNNSWLNSGLPIFMGKGNSLTGNAVGGVTQNRTDIGNGAAFAPPATGGRENTLEVRWSKQDAVNGLNDPTRPNDVRVGQGGEWVILVGKQAVAG